MSLILFTEKWVHKSRKKTRLPRSEGTGCSPVWICLWRDEGYETWLKYLLQSIKEYIQKSNIKFHKSRPDALEMLTKKTKMKGKRSCCLGENTSLQHLQLWTNVLILSMLSYYQNIGSFYKEQKTSIQYLEIFSDKNAKFYKVHSTFFFLNKVTIILG